MRLLVALIGLGLATMPVSAATYYVSPTGSDSQAGTSPGTPWATTARVASAALHPGDTVLFQRGSTFCVGGQYGFDPLASGTATSPITYDAYGTGNQPILSGCGKSQYALGINGAAYLVFNNLEFTGAAIDAVSIWETSNLTFSGDIFTGSGDVGLNIEGSDGSVCNNIRIINSTISSNRNLGILDACPGDSLLVQGNILYSNVTSTNEYGAAIRVVSDGTSDAYRQTNAHVLGNAVFGNGAGSGGSTNFTGVGIHMDTVGNGMLVAGNFVQGNAGNGIEIEWTGTAGNHIVEANTVIGNGAAGILLYRRSWGVSITNNVVIQNAMNLVVAGEYGGDATKMMNNVIAYNWNYSPAPGGIAFAAYAGAQNDGVNGAGNTYLDNCFGDTPTGLYEFGASTYQTTASLVAASSGAVSANCSASQMQ